MTSHQYEVSALVSETSFRGEPSGGVVKGRLFSQASKKGLTKFNDFNNKIVKLRRHYADTKSHSVI